MTDINMDAPEVQEAIKTAAEAKAEELFREKTSGLEANRNTILDEKKELEQKLEAFKDVDLQEWQKLRKANEEAEAEKARQAGKFDELLELERQKFATTIAEKDKTIERLDGSLHKTLVESAAKTAIAKHEGDVDLLLPHVTASAKLLEQDGQHVAAVIDSKGEARLAPDAKTAADFMTIEQLVGGWKDEGKFAGAFTGTGASGGGAPAGGSGGGSGGTPPKTISPDDLHKYTKEVQKGEIKVVVD